MNTVVFHLFHKTDRDTPAFLEGCEVGVPKTMTVTVTPQAASEEVIVASLVIQSVEGYEEPVVEEAEEITEEPPIRPGVPKAIGLVAGRK